MSASSLFYRHGFNRVHGAAPGKEGERERDRKGRKHTPVDNPHVDSRLFSCSPGFLKNHKQRKEEKMRFKVVHGGCVDEEMGVSASRDGGGVIWSVAVRGMSFGMTASWQESQVEHPGPERIIP